jgi:Aconitase A
LKRQQMVAEDTVLKEITDVLLPVLKIERKSQEEIKQLSKDTGLGSVIFAVKPGDGSAREQAASCQKVLGGDANIAIEYATKRYRSNLINWGIVPFTIDASAADKFTVDDLLYVPRVRQAIQNGAERVEAYLIHANGSECIELKLENLSKDDRDIISAGCLINYYAK